MLMSTHPVATQVGATTEHTVSSRYDMRGAYRVLVSGEGVEGEVVAPEEKDEAKKNPLQSLKVRFTVAEDAQPGVREFRLATPQGVSTVGQLVVGRQKVIAEQGKNDTLQQAQEIETPATVCGVIERAEDVDFFKFSAKAGEALSFHVRSMRLQNKIHDLQQHADPILTLRTAAGVTLAASDNRFFGDPFLGYRFERDGEYALEIRDVRYQGNRYWTYSVQIEPGPFVTNVFPLGVTPGAENRLELVGFALPESPSVTLSLPEDASVGPSWMQLPLGDGLSNPAPLVVSDLPQVIEGQEGNDSPETAMSLPIPAGVSGQIEREADLDYWSFEAKKGDKLSFELVARRMQSELDSHLRVLDEKGKQLALNDDLRLGRHTHADSWVENFTAPADGQYFVEIRDLHLRGGPEFVYFLKATQAEPYFDLYLDTDKTQLTPGTSGVIFARVERKNGFEGEVRLAVEGLPQGVTAACGRILAGKGQDGTVVLTASEDAEQTVSQITVTGTATHGEGDQARELSATAQPQQETYQPGGGRGHWPVSSHVVSVGAPSDLRRVEVGQTEITLKPGQSQQIDVKIVRAEGFDKNVTLDVQFRHLNGVYGDPLPEGVTLDAKNSQTLLTGKTSEGHITLTAAENAPAVEKQQICVMASVAINFVMKATYASEPIYVTVEKKPE